MNLKKVNCMLKAGRVRIHTTYLPFKVYGFVYLSYKGIYHIFINESLTMQAKREVLVHEIHHIANDMPNFTYFIGIDIQWEDLERKAVTVAREKNDKYMANRLRKQ